MSRQAMDSTMKVIRENSGVVSYLQPDPWIKGATIVAERTVTPISNIFKLGEEKFITLFLEAREVARLLCDKLAVHRCALVSYPSGSENQIQVLPLHGVDSKWKAHIATDEEYNETDPGYCTSKNGPRWSDDRLKVIQTKIRKSLAKPDEPNNFAYHGNPSDKNLFAQIVRGELQQWRIWQDKQHVAFLTPFPNTPGYTVVVPRRPLSSDIFSLDKEDYIAFIEACKKVALLLQVSLNAHGTSIIFEGLEIDYAHAKLIPLLTSPQAVATPSKNSEFVAKYPGFVTSVSGPKAETLSLDDVFQQILA